MRSEAMRYAICVNYAATSARNSPNYAKKKDVLRNSQTQWQSRSLAFQQSRAYVKFRRTDANYAKTREGHKGSGPPTVNGGWGLHSRQTKIAAQFSPFSLRFKRSLLRNFTTQGGNELPPPHSLYNNEFQQNIYEFKCITSNI